VCGAALEAPAAAGGEERKVVSVLFVDLVAFTAWSDQADPEDVRARLRPYHSMLKREIEQFGGTVEKFIGDAVMAVFGAPVAHEDDAERGVRAALRIVEAIENRNDEHPGLDLSVRAAVNTGEALVSLSARPERGEGIVTGDVVNTASRLQGVAPVGGVAVGELTYRATRSTIEYAPLEPVTVKGKQEPLQIWARAASARSVDRDRAVNDTVHRTRRRAGVVAADVHAGDAGVVGAVGDGDRRAGRREEPVDERVLHVDQRPAGADLLAARSLSALWRGDHVLGAW
jgi:class 3 adenylate cyclase